TEIFEDSTGKKKTFVRLTQPKDVVHFLPDIAVLKLRTPTLIPPLEMDFRAVPKTAESLEVWGFPSSSKALQQDDSNRWSSAYPFLTPSSFIRTTKYGNTQKVGLKPEELFSQDMLLISAQVHDGNSGGPLLNKEGKVIGVVTQAFSSKMGTAYGQATPVIMVKSVLDFLGITEEVLGKSVTKPVADQAQVDPCKLQPELCKSQPVSSIEKLKNWLSTTTNQAILAIGVLCLVAAGAIGWMRLSSGSHVPTAPPPVPPAPTPVPPAPTQIPPSPISRLAFSLKLSNAGATRGEIAFPTPKKMATLIAGRDPKSAHFVFDADASDVGRLHAQFTWSESHNKLFVEDLKSTNGTFVNGTKIQNNTMVELKDGDTVDLGVAGKNRFTVRKH
ncbi:MAG: FHA domain-containing protein, partial [Actinomycetota bacterium]|nr:FHA domain-containing protein [Actinomycetota bacterium]